MVNPRSKLILVKFPQLTDQVLDVPYRSTVHPVKLWVHSPAEPQTLRRPPLLLVHGFRGDHHGLEFLAAYCSNYPVVIPDLPGFGATAPLPDGLTLDGYKDILMSLITHLTREHQAKPILIGHSFGSILAAHTAATFPNSIHRLGLLAPITDLHDFPLTRIMTWLTRQYYRIGAALYMARKYCAGTRMASSMARSLLSSPVIVRAMSEAMATTRDPGLRACIHHQHAQFFSSFADPVSLNQACAIALDYTVNDVAERLPEATIICAGDSDAIVPLPTVHTLIRRMHSPAVHIYPGVGHLLHYERPEAMAHDIIHDLAAFSGRQ